VDEDDVHGLLRLVKIQKYSIGNILIPYIPRINTVISRKKDNRENFILHFFFFVILLHIMRLDVTERKALKYALREFTGDVYLFGSRVNMKKRGGDIDLLLIPGKKTSSLRMALKVQARYFSQCEQKLDVVVYDDKDPFCREIIKSARRIDTAEL
jgi:predicted nucleotidyltransferase